MKDCTVNGVKIDGEVEFHFAANPKRPHAKVHARYEEYSAATNLEEYCTIVADSEVSRNSDIMPSLRYDHANGYLTFTVDGEPHGVIED